MKAWLPAEIVYSVVPGPARNVREALSGERLFNRKPRSLGSRRAIGQRPAQGIEIRAQSAAAAAEQVVDERPRAGLVAARPITAGEFRAGRRYECAQGNGSAAHEFLGQSRRTMPEHGGVVMQLDVFQVDR